MGPSRALSLQRDPDEPIHPATTSCREPTAGSMRGAARGLVVAHAPQTPPCETSGAPPSSCAWRSARGEVSIPNGDVRPLPRYLRMARLCIIDRPREPLDDLQGRELVFQVHRVHTLVEQDDIRLLVGRHDNSGHNPLLALWIDAYSPGT